MNYYYQCENDYCNKKWNSETKLKANECPYCGCKFLIIEELPTYNNNKRKKKKKGKN